MKKISRREIDMVSGAVSHYCFCTDATRKVTGQLVYPEESRYCPNKTAEWQIIEKRCDMTCSFLSQGKYWGLLVAMGPKKACGYICPAS